MGEICFRFNRRKLKDILWNTRCLDIIRAKCIGYNVLNYKGNFLDALHHTN